MYSNIENKTLSVDMNKPNISPNLIPEKNKRYESNRNRIHPKYERLALAVYSHHYGGEIAQSIIASLVASLA